MSDMRITFMMEGYNMHKKVLLDEQEIELRELEVKQYDERQVLYAQLDKIQADCPHDHVEDKGDNNYHKNVWEDDWTCMLCGKSNLPSSIYGK